MNTHIEERSNSRCHLLRLLRGYIRRDNQQRPHGSLTLAAPEPAARELDSPEINP
jgi:hypothetical protein